MANRVTIGDELLARQFARHDAADGKLHRLVMGAGERSRLSSASWVAQRGSSQTLTIMQRCFPRRAGTRPRRDNRRWRRPAPPAPRRHRCTPNLPGAVDPQPAHRGAFTTLPKAAQQKGPLFPGAGRQAVPVIPPSPSLVQTTTASQILTRTATPSPQAPRPKYANAVGSKPTLCPRATTPSLESVSRLLREVRD